MLFSYIFLQCSFTDHLPLALALCLIPFLLGWLAARTYYNVGQLRDKIASLTTSNDSLHAEITDVRVKLTQAEAEIERLKEELRKSKSDLAMCESERNALREQLAGGGKNPASITFAGKKWKWDDLKIVEGVGPKIAELLNKAGIKTWKALADSAADSLKKILDKGGSTFQIHDPSTWPAQARLAVQEKWEELKKLQDELTGGKA
jgi:predicted flap endonuclease-1-like 5' DNA nuclease